MHGKPLPYHVGRTVRRRRAACSRLLAWAHGHRGPEMVTTSSASPPCSDQPFADFSFKTLMRGVNPGRARPRPAASAASAGGTAGAAALDIPDAFG